MLFTSDVTPVLIMLYVYIILVGCMFICVYHYMYNCELCTVYMHMIVCVCVYVGVWILNHLM